MKIGVVKEIKNKENRVAVTPEGVKTLVANGHCVVVETQAGSGSAFSDQEYRQAGAEIADAEAVWATELVVKVKEPLPSEYAYLQGQKLFTFLHLAGAPRELTLALLETRTTAIAYETLEDPRGQLPILAPMSAIAGNMAALIGGYYLARFNQGKGVQLGSVFGEQHGNVTIIGDGTVGQHAARVACGLGAKVRLFGRHEEKGRMLKNTFLPTVEYLLSTADNITKYLPETDVLIGAVLLKGAKAPYVVTEAMVQRMAPGSVIVDVSIDQGGCIATSRPTSHSAPVFMQHGIIHYGVTNMPGAYPRTSTIELTRASLPYVLQIANADMAPVKNQAGLAKAVNTYQGYITSLPVASAWNMEARYKNIQELL